VKSEELGGGGKEGGKEGERREGGGSGYALSVLDVVTEEGEEEKTDGLETLVEGSSNVCCLGKETGFLNKISRSPSFNSLIKIHQI
jgi:hypothetical protein